MLAPVGNHLFTDRATVPHTPLGGWRPPCPFQPLPDAPWTFDHTDQGHDPRRDIGRFSSLF